MERIAWLVFGTVVLAAALRANGSARARRLLRGIRDRAGDEHRRAGRAAGAA